MDARDARDGGGSRGLEVPDPAGFGASKSKTLDGERAAASGRKGRRAKVFPPIDEHLVVPEETREEIIKGRRVISMPALEPHADANTNLDLLFAAHVVPGYIVSCDLLTRVSEGSDFATDVSVRKAGLDPETGKRYLEEFSVEIVNEQRMRDVNDKGDELTWRGVRRVFAVFVKKNEIGEWSRKQRKFVFVDKDGSLLDPLFVRPIPFKAWLDADLASNEAVKAFTVKENCEIVKLREMGRKQGIDEGILEGRRETLLEQLEDVFGQVPSRYEKRIRSAGIDEIRVWAKKLRTSDALEDVFESS